MATDPESDEGSASAGILVDRISPALSAPKSESSKPVQIRTYPVGQKRLFDVAVQTWPRDNFWSLNCLAVALTAGVILKEEKKSSLVGERQFGRHLRRQFGRGQLRVEKIISRRWGDNFCRENVKMSRRALWVPAQDATKTKTNVYKFAPPLGCRPKRCCGNTAFQEGF